MMCTCLKGDSFSCQIGFQEREKEKALKTKNLCTYSYSLKSLLDRAQLESLLVDLFKDASVGEFLDISFFDTADEHRIEVETLKLVFSLMEVRYRILEAATPYYSSFKLKVLDKIELSNESNIVVEAFSSSLVHKTKYSYIDVREAR